MTLVTALPGGGPQNEGMTTFTPQQTVGEIAAAWPASVRVFEKHRIDFCCGGKLPLAEACETRGVDPAALLEEIREANTPQEDGTDWQTAPLAELIEHIVSRHHVYLKTELPRLQAMLEKILSKHSARYGEVLLPLAETFHAMQEELLGHLMKEEMILFPMIARTAPGAMVKNPISVMLMEHDSAGGALARLRQLTSGYTPPADACNTFRAFYFELGELERDLHRHIHLENHVLFPRALA